MIAAVKEGLTFALVTAAFWFGFRHGIDWDHIAAITDITSSQEERKHSLLFGTLYALGHALVVLLLGVVAILVGERLPQSVDEAMGRIVGITLLVLGVYVFYSLIRHGRDFRLRSRWMLIFSGVRKSVRWARQRVGGGSVAVAEAPGHVLTLGHEEDGPPAHSWHHGHHGRPGHHHHVRPEPDDTFANYSRATSFVVGLIHGVGAETPTQILLFLYAARVGVASGIVVLLAFIVGLLASNSLITLGSTWGFLSATRNFPVYAAVAVLTGVFSLFLGVVFLLNRADILPAFFGG